MNFLLGRGAPAIPPLVPPAPAVNTARQSPSSCTAARFRVTLGTGVCPVPVPSTLNARTEAVSICANGSLPRATVEPLPSGGAEPPCTCSPSSSAPSEAVTVPVGGPRYGGALVRVSDLQRTGLVDVVASSGLHLRAQSRGLQADSRHSVIESERPHRPGSPTLGPAALFDHPDVPLSQLFHSEQGSAGNASDSGRSRYKRTRTASARSGRGASRGPRTRSRRRVTRARATATAVIALQPDGAPYESSWYTKQHKRYFVYDNKTYRGRQAYKVWKQVQEAERAYSQRRIRPAATAEPSSEPSAQRQRRPQVTMPVSASGSPPTSRRARHAALLANTQSAEVAPGSVAPLMARTTAQRPLSAQQSPLSRLFTRESTSMVKRPVHAPQARLAAIYSSRPPAVLPMTASTTAQRSTPVAVVDVEEMHSDEHPQDGMHGTPVAEITPWTSNAAFTRSFFDLSGSEDSSVSEPQVCVEHDIRVGSSSEATSDGSATPDAVNVDDDVVTVDDWVYPRALWEQMHTCDTTTAPTHGVLKDPIEKTPFTRQTSRGGLHVLSNSDTANQLQPTRELSDGMPPRRVAVPSSPVIDRYDTTGLDGPTSLHGADLEGMFDVAEEHGALRFQ